MSKVNKLEVSIFLLISLVLYVLFIFFPKDVPVIKLEYSGIILCFIFSLLFIKDKKDTWIVRFALFFTLISDAFLLVLGKYFVIGVSTFVIVQLLYAYRLWLMNDKRRQNYIFLILRIGLVLIVELMAIIILKEQLDLLVIITMFYFANLSINVIYSYLLIKKNVLFAIGLTLFLLCDIMVGLGNSQAYLNINSNSIWHYLLHFPIDLAWFFYFPSQVCIVLSIIVNKKYIKEG